ncbi:MAG: hypothetical protein JNN04_10180 [Cyclobacteriaceae bacterium]|nr:hypothetical protein [Cyclobacteriaceae bacterium]
MVRPLPLLFAVIASGLLPSCTNFSADNYYKSLLPDGATEVDSITLSSLTIGETYQLRLCCDTLIQLKIQGRDYHQVTGESTYRDSRYFSADSSFNYSSPKSTDTGTNTLSAFRDTKDHNILTIKRGQILDIQKDTRTKTVGNFFKNVFNGVLVLLLLYFLDNLK